MIFLLQAYTDVKSGIISVSAKMGPQLKLFATQNNHQDVSEIFLIIDIFS